MASDPGDRLERRDQGVLPTRPDANGDRSDRDACAADRRLGAVARVGNVRSCGRSSKPAAARCDRGFRSSRSSPASVGGLRQGSLPSPSLAPNFVSAATLASPRPFTVSSITPEQPAVVESPVPHGFGRVQRGESIETFAHRILGDAGRWPEIWELNRDQAVGPDGEAWLAPWKLGAGWDLRLPAGAVPVVGAEIPTVSAVRTPSTPVASAWSRRENLTVVDEYEVVEGDSFWEIAERFLPEGSTEEDVWEFTQALMEFNGPRLGYAHPAMISPGDIVEIVAVAPPPASPGDIGEPAASEMDTVVAGDSYWEIAEEALGDGAAADEVLELTEDLIDINSPRLAYDNPWMIHPGDVVYLADPEERPPESLPAPTTSVDVDAIAIDELPPPPPTTIAAGIGAIDDACQRRPPPRPRRRCRLPRCRHRRRTAAPSTDDGSPSSPIGIGQAALIATGIVALLAARRRARLRAAEPPARVPLPRPETSATERTLRRLDASERLLRIDIVLRAAAAELADGDQRVVVVRSAPDGTIEIHLTAPATLSAPWCGSERRWTMPGTVLVDDLAASARSVGAPCVALVQIGVDNDDWDVLVDLEATGVLAVDAGQPAADQIVRALAVGLASSEFAEVAHLVGVGIEEDAFLGHRHAQVVPTVDEAIELAATLIGTTAASTRTTFSLRSHHTSGEMWEPAVILVATAHAAELASGIAAPISARGGLAIVVGAPLERASWTLRPDAADLWSLEPLGLRLRPVGMQPEDVDDLVDLFTDTIEADVERMHEQEPVEHRHGHGDRRGQRPQQSASHRRHDDAAASAAFDGRRRRVQRPTVVADGTPARPRRGRRQQPARGQVRTFEDAGARGVARDPSCSCQRGPLRARRCGTSTFATPRSPTSCPKLGGRWPATFLRPPATSGCAAR